MEELSVWKLDDGGELHWVVASDESDARAILAADMRQCGLDDYTEEDIVTVERLPPEYVLKITDEDGRRFERPSAEWIRQYGRGYVGGTCW